jgi:subtilase family serine protease
MVKPAFLFAALAVVIVLVLGGFAQLVTSSTASSQNIIVNADPPHYYLGKDLSSLQGNDVCRVAFGPTSIISLHCYTPEMIQKAYNFLGAYRLVGGLQNAGKGQTIVIIDAFGSPTITSDLQVFDEAFGLPSATLNIICPFKCPVFNINSTNEIGWSFETTLDVEYAHAMAPAATIDLVVAPTNSFSDLYRSEIYVLHNNLGEIWSQSWGVAECLIGPTTEAHFNQAEHTYAQAVAKNITLIASAGDGGAQEGCPAPSAVFPSSSPFTLAVGGTHLNLGPTGNYLNETAWNDEEDQYLLSQGVFLQEATGGAPSTLFAAPSYQKGITLTPYNCETSTSCATGSPFAPTTRTTVDVSYDADLDGAVLGYWSVVPSQAGFYLFGGTSAGAPQWAAIIAIADQYHHASLGWVNARLYELAGSNAFHDVAVGSNTLRPGQGFLATTGYDAPTGLGSPNVGVLVQDL